jgi:hypothetical protein
VGVEITRRSAGDRTWLFALNYADQTAELELPAPGLELLSGKKLSKKLELAPKGVAIIELHN